MAHPPPESEATIINFPGNRPDLELRFHDRIFYVNSGVLVVYSQPFREIFQKIHDEGYKNNSPTILLKCKDEGELSLSLIETSPPIKQEASSPSSTTSKHISQTIPPNPTTTHQTHAFGNLLRALHSRQYKLTTTHELSLMTTFAQSLCILPSLSTSLNSVLHHSPLFLQQIREYCDEILYLAYILRNGDLFREALVHVVSKWASFKDFNIRDEAAVKLVMVVVKANNRVCERVLRVNEGLFGLIEGGEGDGRLRGMLGWLKRGQPCTANARFYREVLKGLEGVEEEEEERVRGLLELLLESGLRLDGGVYEAGVEGVNGFLCAEIGDDEFPWCGLEDQW